MPKFTLTIPKPVVLAAEALAAGAAAAGIDAVQAHLATSASLPSAQALLGWFAVGALTWAGANLRKTYAGLLTPTVPAPVKPPMAASGVAAPPPAKAA